MLMRGEPNPKLRGAPRCCLVALAVMGCAGAGWIYDTPRGEAARSTGQHASQTLRGQEKTPVALGLEREGAKCDGTYENVAWCEDRHLAVFCAGGTFYGARCGTALQCVGNPTTHAIDCVEIGVE